jgi:hypothetical protein
VVVCVWSLSVVVCVWSLSVVVCVWSLSVVVVCMCVHVRVTFFVSFVYIFLFVCFVFCGDLFVMRFMFHYCIILFWLFSITVINFILLHIPHLITYGSSALCWIVKEVSHKCAPITLLASSVIANIKIRTNERQKSR